ESIEQLNALHVATAEDQEDGLAEHDREQPTCVAAALRKIERRTPRCVGFQSRLAGERHGIATRLSQSSLPKLAPCNRRTAVQGSANLEQLFEDRRLFMPEAESGNREVDPEGRIAIRTEAPV